MLSNDISTSDLVMEVDCCEMTICEVQMSNLTLLLDKNANYHDKAKYKKKKK